MPESRDNNFCVHVQSDPFSQSKKNVALQRASCTRTHVSQGAEEKESIGLTGEGRLKCELKVVERQSDLELSQDKKKEE